MVQLASCVNLANSKVKEVARLKTYYEDRQAYVMSDTSKKLT